MAHVLIIEDDALIRRSLGDRLEDEGYRVTTCEEGASGTEVLAEGDVDLLLLDIVLPDVNGLELLEEVRSRAGDLPVIAMTGHSTVEDAVEAMRRGAYDYVSKPFNMDAMVLGVEKALETRDLREQVARRVEADRAREGFERIVGESPAMEEVFERLERIVASDATTVLVQGESGTGKGLVARAIHVESRRAPRPFVHVTCSAMPANLLESELFGHEAGAFTGAEGRKRGLFEEADGGTVFLDEIGDMDLALQAKLLRVLEDRTFRRVGGNEDLRVDVRVVAATNVDLEEAVDEGSFRSDLFYRLHVVPVDLPPLRERPGDVPRLAEHFLETFGQEMGRSVEGFTEEAMTVLEAHSWPGNVRELRNVIERAMILGRGDRIGASDLVLGKGASGESDRSLSDEGLVLPPGGLTWDEALAGLVRQALERMDWNQTRAAELLGLSRYQVRYRMEKYGLEEDPG